jgi:hypothetical protein
VESQSCLMVAKARPYSDQHSSSQYNLANVLDYGVYRMRKG